MTDGGTIRSNLQAALAKRMRDEAMRREVICRANGRRLIGEGYRLKDITMVERRQGLGLPLIGVQPLHPLSERRLRWRRWIRWATLGIGWSIEKDLGLL